MALAVEELRLTDARAAIADLASLLADCVAGGASVGFLDGFGLAEAAQYFRNIFEGDVAKGKARLFAARDGRRIVGTVQLVLDMMPNQPHRAEVRKLLVHRAARGRGIAEALMKHVEMEARLAGRRLLVLDTVPGTPADRLYTRLGWQRAGVIPDYALWPNGDFCDTCLFYKRIAP
ncbi:MAG TPA: GNAT family N-acetyltransferase [Rhizomicrobium sp.]|jgi:GNAT superfamily N-acetyltransferase|nr:GNAT family N-acetyltransferase [Rhizomicrobium sp.]